MLEDDPEVFNEFWEKTLTLLLRRISSPSNISIMGNAKEVADLFTTLIQDQNILTILLDMKQFPWIPGPTNINLKGGFGSCTGNMLENYSPLGVLFKISLFPDTINLKASKDWSKMVTLIKNDLHSSKSHSVFDKQSQKYQEILVKYASSL